MAGFPVKSATSRVKKSLESMNQSTFFSPMWSASTWYSPLNPMAVTAAVTAFRTSCGQVPMMVCSRFDLFHTGATVIPASLAWRMARNCAFAW